MSRRLTAEQLLTLDKWVEHYETAKKGWARYPGREALSTMVSIWEAYYGKSYGHLVMDCGRCVLSLLVEMGKIYDAEHLASREAVVSTREGGETKKKVPVKTRKKNAVQPGKPA